jgi:hypothetical protein
VVFVGLLMLTALLTAGLQKSTGEVLPRFAEGRVAVATDESEGQPGGLRAWYRLSRRRQQLMAMIITDHAQAVSDNILKELKRGVTAISGTGMYTGKSHSVLLCALTVTEVNHLKNLVNSADPQAFVIVSPAQEILGRGFLPLTVKK